MARSRWTRALFALLAASMLVLSLCEPGASAVAIRQGRTKPYVPHAQRYKPVPHSQTGHHWKRTKRPKGPKLPVIGALPTEWSATEMAEPDQEPTVVAPDSSTATAAPESTATATPLAALADTKTTGPSTLDGNYGLELVDHSTVDRLGTTGLVFAVTAEPGSDQQAKFVVNYDEIARQLGTDWASRLQISTLPACALTTPDQPECQRPTLIRDTKNDTASQQVSATLPDIAVGDVPEASEAPSAQDEPTTTPTGASTASPSPSATASDAGANAQEVPTNSSAAQRKASTQPGRPRGPTSRKSTAARSAATTSQGATVVSVAPGPGGSQGSYLASDLSPTGSWSQSGAAGNFTWDYPIATPPAAAGDVTPDISLSYDSASVDGLNANANPQASWLGLGFDYQPGYIERSYRTCSEMDSSSTDQGLCYDGQILTLHMPGGGTTALVVDSSTGAIRTQNDNGERVEHLVGGPNGAGANGSVNYEYWRVTTTDGTQYTFGANILPGGSASTATHSAWTVPVRGMPISGCTQSRCQVVWRWNLDMVEDVHHNVAAYYYANATNYFHPSGMAASARGIYDRSGSLARIDYGIRNVGGSIYGATPPERVDFATATRCIVTGEVRCIDDRLDDQSRTNWPDVPLDQACPASGTCANDWPSFWTSRYLASISTSYFNGSSYVGVDAYTFLHGFSATTTTPALEMIRIDRTASDAGQSTTVPPVYLYYGPLENRVAGYKNMPGMVYDRLMRIESETGARTQVTYSGDPAYPDAAAPQCTANSVPAPENDNMECYPVKWAEPGQSKLTLDYFHKYVAVAIDESDPNGLTPTKHTAYRYSGPGWHFDDNEVLKAKARTYGQWRGYRSVQTITGDTQHQSANGETDQATSTKSLYYLGMGASNVTDSRGATLNDADEFAGMLAEQQVFDGSTEISDVRNTPTSLATTATRPRDPGFDGPAIITGTPLAAHVVATASSLSVTDGIGSGASNLVSQTATTFGAPSGEPYLQRPTKVTVISSGGTGTTKNTCTTTSYADNTSTWVRNAPAEVSTFDSATCPADDSTLVSRSRSYYDGNTALGGGNISAGDATRSDAAADRPGGTVRYTSSTTGYDALGRATSSTAYPDGIGTPSTARTTTTAYATSGGSPTGTTTTLPNVPGVTGATTSTTIDPARGVQTRSTDVAGRVTSSTIDALGRYTAVWQPGRTQGTDSASSTYSYQLASGSPLAITTKKLVDAGNSTTPSYVATVQIYDSRGILRQTQTDAPGGGRAISDSFVDSHGWTVRTNDRWYTTGAPTPSEIVTTADGNLDARTMTKYDRTGRPVQVAHWKGNDTQPVDTTTTIYGGDRTTVLPPSGAVATTSLVNGLGQQTELDRYTTAVTAGTFAGSPVNRTTYAYTAAGSLSTMTTAAGTSKSATWSNTYDLLGRETKADDPDTGISTTSYNDVGETTSTSDASAHTVSTTYDAWGRSTARYAGSVATGTQIAAWTYDTLARGSLTSTRATIPSLSGGAATTFTTTVVGYTPAGQPTGTDLSLNVTGFLAKYGIRQTYTSTGQVATRTYGPTLDSSISQGMSAEKMTLWYDRLGNQNALTGTNGYVTGATFTPYNEPSQYVLGVNNATTAITYTRDPNSRRVTNTLLSGQIAPPQVENIATSYDQSGNPTRTIDTRGPAGSPTQTTCYRYDALRQLTDAWAANDNCSAGTPQSSVIGGAQPYWESWTYDSDGSRATQTLHGLGGSTDTATTYTNGVAGHAHALSSATTTGPNTAAGTGIAGQRPTTQSATYTATGATNSSTTPAGSSSYVYRSDGRLGTITSPGGAKTEYFDDVDGSHLMRVDTTSSATERTLYLPGQQLTLRVAGSTKTLTTTRYYRLEGGQQIAVRKNNANPVFTLADPSGTAQLTYDPFTNTTNPPTQRRAFDPYGNPLSTTGSTTWIDDHNFLNKPQSTATGLVDAGAREYDPLAGRFMSADPVLDPSDPVQDNGYNYAANNPATFSDPAGTWVNPDVTKPPPTTPYHPTHPLSNPIPTWPHQPAASPATAAAPTHASAGSSQTPKQQAVHDLVVNFQNPFANYQSSPQQAVAAYQAGIPAELAAYWPLFEAGGDQIEKINRKLVPLALTVINAAIAADTVLSIIQPELDPASVPLDASLLAARTEFKQTAAKAAASSATHGNSASSPARAYLYRLYDSEGAYLKTGISKNPASRYTKTFMEDKSMDIMQSGTRREMLNLERYIVERDPGPLNREPWAGRFDQDVP